MTHQEIYFFLIDRFGESVIIKQDTSSIQTSFTVSPQHIALICNELYNNHQTYFDFLSCITAIDNGPEKGTMEIVYNLYSIPYNSQLTLKVELIRNKADEPLPELPSVSHIWRTADWHEREAYDLMGIKFTGHPDLRRILLTADWQGHPLRKDYQIQETYHGIKVAY
jgi:NADH-quinone oxidoreductase subunit C